MVHRSAKLENDERDIKFPFLLHQRQHRAPLNYAAHGVVFTRRDERNYTVDHATAPVFRSRSCSKRRASAVAFTL
jgi:hypothetical protein